MKARLPRRTALRRGPWLSARSAGARSADDAELDTGPLVSPPLQPPARPAPARAAPLMTAERWSTLTLLLSLTGLAFLLRAYHLGQSYDIHVDELTYLDLGRTVAERLQVRLYGEPFFLHPPAYFFTEAAVLRLFPSPDLIGQIFTVRYINVVFGALTAGLVFLIGRALAGRAAGLTAALLFAVEPFAILNNSRSLLDTTALFWVLLGWWLLTRRAVRRDDRRWPVLPVGLSFGLALLTKDMTLFITLLPLLGLGLTRWVVPLRVAGRVALTAALTYLPYLLITFAAGEGRLFLAEKFSGVSRFLGATKTTGFKREGGPSLSEALLSNLPTFGLVYALALLGVPALYLLWRSGRRRLRLLALFVGSAYLLLAFLVLIGTLEEQFFYYLAVPAMLAVSVAFWTLLRRADLLRPAVRVLGAAASVLAYLIFIGWSSFSWLNSHLLPGDGYVRLLQAMRAQVPAGSRVSTLTTESIFLLGRYTTGIWQTPDALRANRTQYALLSTQQVETGYGFASPALYRWLRANARLIASAPSRSYGELQLYRLPDSVVHPQIVEGLTTGRRGWLYLTSEHQTDAAVPGQPGPAAYAADTLIQVGELLRERGEALSVALVPTKTRVYGADLPADLGTDLNLRPEITARYAATLARLRQAGVAAPDLARIYAQALARPDAPNLYLQQDHHWTPQGALLAAQAVAQSLQGRVNLSGLPAAPSTLSLGSPEPSPLHSLYSLLPPEMQARLPRETLTPYRVVDQPVAGQGDLLGDGAPGVALVGSSFAATPVLQFAPLLQHALGHEVLDAAEGAVGPWQSLLDYVRNDAYQDAPPALIVWEFWEQFLNGRGVGGVPFGYLLDVAANVTTGCDTGGAPIALSGSAGRYTLQVGAAAQPLGDFLRMRVTAPGRTTLRMTFVAGTARNVVRLPFPGDGAAHTVNVPLYALSGATTTGVQLGGDASLKLERPRLCHLPPAIINRAYASLGQLDLLRSTDVPGVQLSGLSEIESTGHRWGLGKRTTLNFFSATNRSVRLQLKFRAPVQNQTLEIRLNGQTLYSSGPIYRGDVTDVWLTLSVKRGLNTLDLQSALQSGGAARFVPGDDRPLTVEYSRFSLSDE